MTTWRSGCLFRGCDLVASVARVDARGLEVAEGATVLEVMLQACWIPRQCAAELMHVSDWWPEISPRRAAAEMSPDTDIGDMFVSERGGSPPPKPTASPCPINTKSKHHQSDALAGCQSSPGLPHGFSLLSHKAGWYCGTVDPSLLLVLGGRRSPTSTRAAPPHWGGVRSTVDSSPSLGGGSTSWTAELRE